MPPIGRRTVLKLVSGAMAGASLPWPALARASAATAPASTPARVGDSQLGLVFDEAMRTQVSAFGQPITGFDSSETLLLADGPLDTFVHRDQRSERLRGDRHGAGKRTVVRGLAANGIEKQVSATVYERYPGLVLLQVAYRNGGHAPVEVTGWRNGAHVVQPHEGGFWSFSGATHEDRRDWVRPLDAAFEQRNTLAMEASDYGGGTPVANVWRRDVGLAVGHVETVPRLLDMPVRATDEGAAIGIESVQPLTLAPGATLLTDRTFVCVHRGDFYPALTHYRRFMQDQGISGPRAPESAFAPVWCAWGYDREFTTEQVIATLPKVREMGFEWAVLDDGWQTNEGDWKLDPRKFPRGDADMRAFVQAVKAQGLRPRLWIAPLACDPGSDVLHDHPDMLLLDKEGSVQKVSWWNAFTQCPAYTPTIDFYVALTRKAIGDWGFEGLKLDGQHLNAVAPCYNPLHKHDKPTDSFEKLADFWNAIHRAAREENPQAVVELCPCGTAFAFHNLPATDQYPASDPTSSWQVRHKGKSVKALFGHTSSYAGDHVELSDGGDDFASSVGVGAVISTKFTWPRDTDHPTEPLPPGGFVLTAEKEKLWRQWLEIYQAHMLPKGEYRGELYDIGFDKPEAHAIAKDKAMYYTFYATDWDGPVQLRGLGSGRYVVRDLFNGTELGHVDAGNNVLPAKFKRFLMLQAVPA
ncbi:glycoside hydrolase [Stenotrophomonas panacihumi]|uniref:Glycoside hydrolase n=1 Tax=Stenotrophomonas panacihumi TaxID=676599 RepID=A0A0R0ATE5_9GAMM|nr:glycoside hydrolase family 36 protein [Stenotrophomonas panacihumi]KRG45274.1 glycoside hydrolase [Stenotrophomonas panacihumi]PTN55487.1 alpha-galactosidase [Stenotrophomonas panacihumi]